MADAPKPTGTPRGPLKRPRPDLTDAEFKEWLRGPDGDPGKKKQ
jgi:hypothetical protein